MRFGAGTVADLTWKQMMDTFSCTECGRCQDVCPAWTHRQGAVAEAADHGRCATRSSRRGRSCCAARDGFEAGAAGAERGHRGRGLGLRDLRRVRARVPGLDRAHRPHRRPAPPPRDGRVALPGRGRADAARRRARRRTRGASRRPSAPTGPSGSACGCSSRATRRPRCSTGSAARRRSTSARARRAESTAKLLQAAGVDFAILGPRESCTGDPARRMGNEYLFQAHAEQNVSTLNEAGVTKIVASCPHCFNTLGNEYPRLRRRLRGRAPHRAARRARARRAAAAERRASRRSPTTTPATWPATTTCARDPRELVAAVGQPIEMERSGKRTFCCGAGGAHMWMEERGRPDQRGARARGGRDRRRDARRRLPVLHGDARRRREGARRRDARGRRLDAARRVARRRAAGRPTAERASRLPPRRSSVRGASAPCAPPR